VVAHAQRLADAGRELREHGATCVLLDITGEGAEPLARLEQLRSAAPDVPIIVLSLDGDEQLGLAAVTAGAQDFLRRSELNPALLARSVRYAIERKRSEAELAHQALHDPLTALPNRALFIDRLTVALDRSRRKGALVAVLFLDVDNFKRINDSMGHAAGDLLLTVLAGRFREMLRPMDTVARFGGDEFTFLFEELESEREAVLIADRISQSASQPVNLGDPETSIAVSIGISIVTDPVTPENAIRDADAAMYRAKEQGGARLELYDENSRKRAIRRRQLEDSLRAAINRSQLRVHYQPRVSLNGSTGLLGFEALVRWEHPERGLIEAGQFVSLAEETGLIVPIGEWVLEQALGQLRRWRQTRPDVSISVNLSARQLEDAGLVATLAATMQATGADPRALWLEVTEDAVQHKPDASSRTLAAVSQLGVRLAIDDFGTGPSSLASLQHLPLDAIKIDQSFVSRLGVEPDGSALVGALVELGHALGLTVLAEGVETDSQAARLRDLGCDGAQGFLFSRPLTEDDVAALLAPA
jgi:diguanylate cyclase (GGDEF)-like protein